MTIPKSAVHVYAMAAYCNFNSYQVEAMLELVKEGSLYWEALWRIRDPNNVSPTQNPFFSALRESSRNKARKIDEAFLSENHVLIKFVPEDYQEVFLDFYACLAIINYSEDESIRDRLLEPFIEAAPHLPRRLIFEIAKGLPKILLKDAISELPIENPND